MLTLYFSGTGNSKHIAEQFSAKLGAACHSIEEALDFTALISAHEKIAVCYPIYGSRVPRIMREFAQRHANAFQGKQLVILATQLIFSGDGARVFTDLFPKGHVQVIAAAHVLMPNNVCNFIGLRQTSARRTKKMLTKAQKQIDQIASDIQNKHINLTGVSGFSKFLGSIQGKSWPSFELRAQRRIKISKTCNACGLCVKLCPTKNLELANGEITHNHNCTLCLRCVNACPKQAITVMFHKKPKWQHHGLSIEEKTT